MRTSVLVAGVFALLLIGCAATPRAHVEITPYAPPKPDDSALASALPEGHTAGQFVDVADIRIVGINNAKAPADTDYLTLHEALKANLCTVAEKDGVNGLAITNRSKQPIFLMVGDLVLGGKQDRIMAESIVVEAGVDGETIPVFCVEHGRWAEEAGSTEFYGRDKSQQADVSVKSAAIATSDQSSVWAAVAENNASLGVSGNTSTGTFRATFDDPETLAKLDAMYAKAKDALTSDTVGFAVIYRSEVVALDVFDSKGLCAKLSEKLLRSYLVTAISSGYDPTPKHPLHNRLEDRVTLQAVNVPMARVVDSLNKQWSVNISLEGTSNTPVTLDLKDQRMFDVLLHLSEASKLPIYIGLGSIMVDARPAAETSEEQVGPRVYAGMPRPHIGDVVIGSEDGAGGQFDNQPGELPLLADIPLLGELFRRSGYDGDAQTVTASLAEDERSMEEELPAQANTEINESTETERKYDEDGVDYACKDKKRESTVHRSYMRR
jgi:hypothetical protein